jgi:hypothetical protein
MGKITKGEDTKDILGEETGVGRGGSGQAIYTIGVISFLLKDEFWSGSLSKEDFAALKET